MKKCACNKYNRKTVAQNISLHFINSLNGNDLKDAQAQAVVGWKKKKEAYAFVV